MAKQRRFAAIVAFASVAGVAASALAAPAYADEPTPLAAISSAAPAATQNLANVPTSETGTNAISTSIDGNIIIVPTDARAGVTIGKSDHTVSIGLPFASQASHASAQGDGVVSYDNNNGSTTVPLVKADGSLEITTVIANSSAPSSYSYPLSVPQGASVTQNSSGAVAVLGADGSLLLAIAAPWAKDANGNAVPTSYVVEGNTLTQKVDLSSANIAFPVVADPWAGIDLIDHEAWITRPGGLTLEVYRTPWGFAWTGSLTWGSWWSELLAKVPSKKSTANTTYVENQLDCHLWFAPVKDPFDLDTYIHRATLADYIAHNCN